MNAMSDEQIRKNKIIISFRKINLMIIELHELFEKIGQLSDEEQRLIANMLDLELQNRMSMSNAQGNMSDLLKTVIIEYQSEKRIQEDW